MKFRSFFWVLITGAVVIFAIAIGSLGWIITQSSINLAKGGVNTFPQAAMFMPRQAPAMVSLLTNPEKLYVWREVSLPLKDRSSDRQQWHEWETSLLNKIGLDYQQDFKPWLGDEITFGITSLDYDRNSSNGTQPGYLLAAATRNTNLAQESLRNFYSQKSNVSTEQYKGANIISFQSSAKLKSNNTPWAGVVVGNFVLFANQPQILREAINQAQAVSLNLANTDYYQTALSQVKKPHVGVAYLNILGTSAWLDKSSALTKPSPEQVLSASLAIARSGLAAETALIATDKPGTNPQTAQTFLDNPELQKIFASLPFDRRNFAYIDLQERTSLLEEQIPLYKVTKLAIQSLFPRLKAIAIQNLGNQEDVSISRTNLDLIFRK